MQHNWPVYGHDWAVDYLRKGILNRRVRHAYLITGTPAIGKMTLARAFAMTLNCTQDPLAARPCGECRSCKRIMSGNQIDLLYAQSDGNIMKIDAVRDITRQIAMKPYESRYRVAILPDFDLAQPRAQDSLLKTLEEPPPHAILILIATSLESILSTITSRSQMIYLRPVPTNVIQQTLMGRFGAEADQATLLARLSGGRIGWAIDALQNPDVLDQRETALQLLDDLIGQNRAQRFEIAKDLSRDKPSLRLLLELWLTYWRDVLLYVNGDPVKTCNYDRLSQIERLAYDIAPEDALRAVQATQNLLGQLGTNLNTRLAVEVLLLDYPGLASGGR